VGRKGTYDVTHEKEDAEVVGLTQALDALVDVLWERGRDLRNRTPVVLPIW
jgi:hypothetical protein